VHTHVREDAIVLYGFATRDQRRCFEALVGTHGVGPSLALAILSAHSPASLQRAVLADDIDALVLVPGVGRKTAARLLIDLKARIDLPDLGAEPTTAARGGAGVRAEVRAALAGLGYGPDEVRQVLQSVPAEGATEEVLRAALRELATTP
jgi:Holliday junction DNA helicase RuvA